MEPLSATPPSPLRWRDLAEVSEQIETSLCVNITVELAWGLHATRGWCSTATGIFTPSVFSPHYGRRSRIVITKQAYLGKDYSMPQLLYKVYWEGAQKVRLLWPVSQIVE
jgi:hypothetical protein